MHFVTRILIVIVLALFLVSVCIVATKSKGNAAGEATSNESELGKILAGEHELVPLKSEPTEYFKLCEDRVLFQWVRFQNNGKLIQTSVLPAGGFRFVINEYKDPPVIKFRWVANNRAQDIQRCMQDNVLYVQVEGKSEVRKLYQ